MDRAIRKLLTLPFFCHEIFELVEKLNCITIEKWLCIEAVTPEQFFDQLLYMAPALVPQIASQPCLQTLEAIETFSSFDETVLAHQ